MRRSIPQVTFGLDLGEAIDAGRVRKEAAAVRQVRPYRKAIA